MNGQVTVLGVGMHPWGKWGHGFARYGLAAAEAALQDAGVEWQEVQLLTASATLRSGYAGLIAATTYARALGAGDRVNVMTTYGACTSGAQALAAARAQILAGECDLALVIGADIASDGPLAPPNDGESSDMNLLRHSLGLTNPVYLAMYARRRMHLHGTTESDLTLVKVKNSVAGSRNPNARYRYELTPKQVNSSPIYCDPLRLLHISAISDGGAAVVLASERFARARGDRGVRLVAVRTPTPGATNGDLEMGELRSTAIGGEARSFRDSLVQDAYRASGIDARELSLAEVYDVSCASELDWYESLGLCDRGDAERLLRDGATSLGGTTPVNASGGLSSLGEAPSAQVLAQLCELTWQLRGDAGARQVPMARLGIAVSQGIFGHGAAVVAMRQ